MKDFGERAARAVDVVIIGGGAAGLSGALILAGPLLLGVRILQGSSAALIAPAALALVTTTFPPGAARNRAFGVYAAMSGAGAGIGLIIGGWLTTALPGDPEAVGRALLQATFTEGVTHAFLVGSILLLIASLIVWTNTRVQPNDAGTDDQTWADCASPSPR
ncbi:MFS transporter [Micromonospora ureilytica]|uniref:MFS transporter n=1 Tax=Micromonospora ureilytica TaxID=709868 RepID=UPI001F0C448E|nr:MFS transporter [Micromonospora ureilytica]